ncbi:hypothetical protein ACVIW0_002365 [Bradyrhizobium sp. USDA 4454]
MAATKADTASLLAEAYHQDQTRILQGGTFV